MVNIPFWLFGLSIVSATFCQIVFSFIICTAELYWGGQGRCQGIYGSIVCVIVVGSMPMFWWNDFALPNGFNQHTLALIWLVIIEFTCVCSFSKYMDKINKFRFDTADKYYGQLTAWLHNHHSHEDDGIGIDDNYNYC